MGPLLSGPGPDPLSIRDETDVALARAAVRERAAAVGLGRERTESLVTAVSEVAHNQARHARGGELTVRAIARGATAGVEVWAQDRGPGITDPSAALRGRDQSAPAGTGLGIGLSAAYRLADEIDFDVRQGEGTTLWLRKFVTPLPRSEVAILGRPLTGERISGDDAFFDRRDEGSLLLAVADGLGHGPLAHQAAARAMGVLRGAGWPAMSPVDLLRACQPELEQGRGAVVAVVRIDPPIDTGTARLVQAGIGNISCQLHVDREATRLPSTPGVVGQMGPRTRIQEQHESLSARHVVAMFTDGLSSRLDLGADPDLLREPALVIAHQLLERHGRDHDDALILVAKG
jgi:anti-sigma regulatory factor (Ser/Thr protein kinase)